MVAKEATVRQRLIAEITFHLSQMKFFFGEVSSLKSCGMVRTESDVKLRVEAISKFILDDRRRNKFNAVESEYLMRSFEERAFDESFFKANVFFLSWLGLFEMSP